MNCSAYEHASASGRPESTLGKLEQCAKGTILLDEFDTMPGAVQRRLLNCWKRGSLSGAAARRRSGRSVRIIAAMSGDLEVPARRREFRKSCFTA